MSRSRQLRVDWPACTAHGVCAELVPELIALDEWGYPLITPGPVPQPLLGHARRAVAACPSMALAWVNTPEEEAPGRRRH